MAPKTKEYTDLIRFADINTKNSTVFDGITCVPCLREEVEYKARNLVRRVANQTEGTQKEEFKTSLRIALAQNRSDLVVLRQKPRPNLVARELIKVRCKRYRTLASIRVTINVSIANVELTFAWLRFPLTTLRHRCIEQAARFPEEVTGPGELPVELRKPVEQLRSFAARRTYNCQCQGRKRRAVRLGVIDVE